MSGISDWNLIPFALVNFKKHFVQIWAFSPNTWPGSLILRVSLSRQFLHSILLLISTWEWCNVLLQGARPTTTACILKTYQGSLRQLSSSRFTQTYIHCLSRLLKVGLLLLRLGVCWVLPLLASLRCLALVSFLYCMTSWRCADIEMKFFFKEDFPFNVSTT